MSGTTGAGRGGRRCHRANHRVPRQGLRRAGQRGVLPVLPRRERQYLTRTRLLDQEQPGDGAPKPRAKTQELWNGTDWYVSFGEELGGRSWTDAAHGMGSSPQAAASGSPAPCATSSWAGGCSPPASPWLATSASVRSSVSQPGSTTPWLTSTARRKLSELELTGDYTHPGGDEWIVPVRWCSHRPRDKAFWKTGMFANQNSAAKLRNRFTLACSTPSSRSIH